MSIWCSQFLIRSVFYICSYYHRMSTIGNVMGDRISQVTRVNRGQPLSITLSHTAYDFCGTRYGFIDIG